MNYRYKIETNDQGHFEVRDYEDSERVICTCILKEDAERIANVLYRDEDYPW